MQHMKIDRLECKDDDDDDYDDDDDDDDDVDDHDNKDFAKQRYNTPYACNVI